MSLDLSKGRSGSSAGTSVSVDDGEESEAGEGVGVGVGVGGVKGVLCVLGEEELEVDADGVDDPGLTPDPLAEGGVRVGFGAD